MNMSSALNTSCCLYAPLDDPSLIPVTTDLQYWLRVTEAGIVSPVSVIVNSLTLTAMVRARLHTNWTYGMICNLCVSQCLISLINVVWNLPNIIAGRYEFHMTKIEL